MVTTHLIPLVTDYNISPTTAGNMLAWLGLMRLVGLLVAGPASDQIGTKTPIALTFLLRFLLFYSHWRLKKKNTGQLDSSGVGVFSSPECFSCNVPVTGNI